MLLYHTLHAFVDPDAIVLAEDSGFTPLSLLDVNDLFEKGFGLAHSDLEMPYQIKLQFVPMAIKSGIDNMEMRALTVAEEGYVPVYEDAITTEDYIRYMGLSKGLAQDPHEDSARAVFIRDVLKWTLPSALIAETHVGGHLFGIDSSSVMNRLEVKLCGGFIDLDEDTDKPVINLVAIIGIPDKFSQYDNLKLKLRAAGDNSPRWLENKLSVKEVVVAHRQHPEWLRELITYIALHDNPVEEFWDILTP